MSYNQETEMYPQVKVWLENSLKEKFRRSEVKCYDTHSVYLKNFLPEKGYANYFDEYSTYEIKVDITGIIKSKKRAELVFVECKLNQINLKDISQLLGYSRVAMPLYSLIMSPEGISDPISNLFKTFKRYDVLEYCNGRKILITKWNSRERDIDYSSVIPPGYHF